MGSDGTDDLLPSTAEAVQDEKGIGSDEDNQVESLDGSRAVASTGLTRVDVAREIIEQALNSESQAVDLS